MAANRLNQIRSQLLPIGRSLVKIKVNNLIVTVCDPPYSVFKFDRLQTEYLPTADRYQGISDGYSSDIADRRLPFQPPAVGGRASDKSFANTALAGERDHAEQKPDRRGLERPQASAGPPPLPRTGFASNLPKPARTPKPGSRNRTIRARESRSMRRYSRQPAAAAPAINGAAGQQSARRTALTNPASARDPARASDWHRAPHHPLFWRDPNATRICGITRRRRSVPMSPSAAPAPLRGDCRASAQRSPQPAEEAGVRARAHSAP
jgi:hypothetical protein